MDPDEIQNKTEKKAQKRAKKKHPKVKMSGKRTREIVRLWKAKK